MDRIVVDGISKGFTSGKGKKAVSTTVLEDITFSCPEGSIFGLIGPDGAGKTTLFRILATLILPDSGQAWIDGLPVVQGFRDIRHRVGYMPGRFSLYQDLTVEENLQLFAAIFKVDPSENRYLVEDIYRQIEPFKHRKAGQLSGGMKQKLALSCALIHRPRVLLLDEPTTGVDAVSRKEFWDMLDRLRVHGLSILVATPYMDEAARCDRVALIQGGRILTSDTPDGIREGFTAPMWAVASPDMYRLLTDLRASPGVASVYAFGDSHHVTLHHPGPEAEAGLRQHLTSLGHTPLTWARIQPGIEDRFMALSRPDHA